MRVDSGGAELLGGGLELVGPSRRDRHPVAILTERPGDCQADSTRSSRDQRSASFHQFSFVSFQSVKGQSLASARCQGFSPRDRGRSRCSRFQLSSLLLAACGEDSEEANTGTIAEAPASAEFPKAGAKLDDLLGEAEQTDQIVASPAGGIFTPDDDRFGFGLFDVGGEQILDAEVAIYAAAGPTGKPIGPFPARVESLATEPEFVAQSAASDDAEVVYVSEVPFDRPGEWRLVAMVRQPDGLVATLLPSVVVGDYRDIPDVGDRAPSVKTPTAEEVGGDLASIDTRVPPTTMHEEDLADVLGKKPVVLLFATPALCQSRVCGPVTDITEQVKAAHEGEDIAFIHMEIYTDNEFGPDNLRPQVKAYGLPTEPWLFVIDRNGDVAERIEGAFSAGELEAAVDRVAG